MSFDSIPAYAQKRESYATDLEQFHDLINQMDGHKQALEQQIKERTAELKQTNEKFEKMNSYIADLKITISSQEMNIDDLSAMESELKGLSEAMDRALSLRDERRKTLAAAEKELQIVCTKLEEIVEQYNSRLSDLQLSPEHAPTLAKLKASLKKENLAETDQSKVICVNLKQTAIPTIDSWMDDFRTENRKVKAEYQDTLDRVPTVKDACKAAENKLLIIQEKTSKCETTLQNEQTAHDAKLAVHRREVEAMEKKVAARRNPITLEEQIAAYERQCAELEALRVQHEEDNVARRLAVQDEIEQAIQLMKDHEDLLRRKRQEVAEYWEKKELRKLKVPENVDVE